MKSKKTFFLFLALFLFLAIVGFKSKQAPQEYESAWLTIAPGESLVIAHPLEITPRMIAVNVKQTYGPQTKDVETVRPHTELPDHPLFIQDMTSANVTIINQGQETYLIKIYVR